MHSTADKIRTARCAGSPANRLCLDYIAEAHRMSAPPAPIVDVHSHINGREAARLYGDVARQYGIALTYSMTQLEQTDAVREALGDRIRFIAVPNYLDKDRRHHLGYGYVDRIVAFHERGARIAKFWAAPRATDYAVELGDPAFMRIDAPHRIEAMQTAHDLGMYFMTHIADPDTWFRTRYTDASKYGTKRQQYEPLEELLDRFDQPWIAAHMGGWPEDLAFVAGLLERHDNLYLDTSATKWMVRELSRHPRSTLVDLLTRFRGRVLFGSDIVTSDDHFEPSGGRPGHDGQVAARGPVEAADLYASRYWALRTLFEGTYVGPSPIADPDLAMVDPDRWGPEDAPPLVGKHLPAELLRDVYHDAAHALLEPLHRHATQRA